MKALLALVSICTISSCILVVDDKHGRGGTSRVDVESWQECRAEGLYNCTDDACVLTSTNCRDYAERACTEHAQCGSGFYCDLEAKVSHSTPTQPTGSCVPSAYCVAETCAAGFTCNEERKACEPGAKTCTADTGCAATERCNPTSHVCEPKPVPTVTCAGKPAATCSVQVAPRCPANQVPTLQAGCYTGQCKALDQCDAAPVCEALNMEASCRARSECAPSYSGRNCRRADGSTCTSGDTNCICQSFAFSACYTEE